MARRSPAAVVAPVCLVLAASHCVLLGACATHGNGPDRSHAAASPDAYPPGRGPSRLAFEVPSFAAVAPRAPITLTTSDGSGLAITSLTSRTTIYGPVAHTEVRLVFSNPEPRQREGRFEIALPQRAFVSRLAMKIDGRLTEADVAETDRARAVYEEIVHRSRDPLLVQQHGTNELSARVFPIPPTGDKEIVVGWISEVGTSTPVTVPLRGLPAIGSLDVEVREGNVVLASRTAKGVVPDGDLRVAAGASSPSAIRAGDVVVARVAVPRSAAKEAAAPIGRGVVVLVDTSASRAGELDGDLGRLRAVLAELAREEPRAPVTVAAFDQGVSVAYRGALAGVDDDAVERLRARGALGASDLTGALRWAAEEAFGARAGRVVLVSDGLATGGEAGPLAMRDAARSLQDAGIERLDAIAVGDVRDESTLRALAAASFSSPGMVIEGGASAEPATAIASRLTRAVLSDVAISARGASRVWPRALSGVQPGDEANVVIDAPTGVTPSVAIAGEPAPIAIGVGVAPPAAVLEKVDAKSRIDALVAAGERDGWSDKQRAKVVGISKAQKIASPFTSFIVVESDADRRELFAPRAAIEKRPSPSRPVPVARVSAPAPASASASSASPPPRAPDPDLFAPPPPIAPPSPPAPPAKRLEARVHHVRVPVLRSGSVMVTGRLPPEVIQRIVRQNFGRFRACYEEGLRRRGPTLRGRVATKFVIGHDGNVASASTSESEIGDHDVESCVADAFRGVQFPVPEGGIVTVTYPFVLRPPGEEETDDPRGLMSSPIHTRGRPSGEIVETPPLLPWSGDYLEVRRALAGADVGRALAIASEARAHDSRDVVALLALGEALEAANLPELAQRAFGSIADLRPNDAESLRVTAARLEHAAGKPTALSIELLRRAVGDRPDLPHGHHLLAVALLRTGAHEEAFEVLARAVRIRYVPRYVQGLALLHRDLDLVSSAWRAAEPARADAIARRTSDLLWPSARMEPEGVPSTTYAVSWETDTSFVELDMPLPGANHIAWSSDGYGPDAWVVRGAERPTVPVVVALHSRGAMGHAFGVVHVMEHDGRGHVTVEPRPFVVMNAGARVNLGVAR